MQTKYCSGLRGSLIPTAQDHSERVCVWGGGGGSVGKSKVLEQGY